MSKLDWQTGDPPDGTQILFQDDIGYYHVGYHHKGDIDVETIHRGEYYNIKEVVRWIVLEE